MSHWLQFYYWGTLGFALLDWLYDIDIRLSALEGHPVWKTIYYVVCVGLAFVIRRLPRLAGIVTLLESSVNLLLLILALLLPYYGFIEQLASGGTPAGTPIDGERIANFLLSGGLWSIGYIQWSMRHRWP